MDFFPLFAKIAGQPCLVVGGGDVARRKATELLAAGARVTVNAPALCDGLRSLAASGRIRVRLSAFEPALVREHLLIIAATADRTVNAAVADTAHAELRLCNVVDDAAASGFFVPAIVDRSPVLIAVSSGGQAPALARLIRQRLARALPAGLGNLAAWAGRWRERVRRKIEHPGARRRFWEILLDGPAGRHALAGADDAADAAAERLLAAAHSSGIGKAWLVGAGPGDPGLITVAGLAALQGADVVVHDRLVAAELLALARRDAELINVGKVPGGSPGAEQDAINTLLVSRVRAEQRVCRLKGGDPLVFGRGGEEALALAAAGLPFEIVPGVTAAAGCGAYAGIPLTHRDVASAVTFVTARQGSSAGRPDWSALARLEHTLVVYMGSARVGEIRDELLRHGRPPDTPAALVSAGTTPRQQVLVGTLADIARRSAGTGFAAPALLFVGATAALARQLSWFIAAEYAQPALPSGATVAAAVS